MNLFLDPRLTKFDLYENVAVYLPVMLNDPKFHAYNQTGTNQNIMTLYLSLCILSILSIGKLTCDYFVRRNFREWWSRSRKFISRNPFEIHQNSRESEVKIRLYISSQTILEHGQYSSSLTLV